MLVSVEKYLRTIDSDVAREYIDGKIVERNVGTFEHSDWQSYCLLKAQTKKKIEMLAGKQ